MRRGFARLLIRAAVALIFATVASCDRRSDGGEGSPNPGGFTGSTGGAGAGAGGHSGEGEGGAGGLAGSGGSGGVGGIIEPPGIPDWVEDSSLWTPLPGGDFWDNTCRSFEARASGIGFPVVEWATCGAGCERADVLQGHGDFAVQPIFQTLGRADDQPFLRISHSFQLTPKGEQILLNRIVDLKTGGTAGATKQQYKKPSEYATCSSLFEQRYAFFSRVAKTAYEPAFETWGVWSPISRTWIWGMPYLPIDPATSTCLAVLDDEGRRFLLCGNKVVAALLPGSTETTSFDVDAGYSAILGGGFGDSVVWTELKRESGSRIRGWAPDGEGVRTVVEALPGDSCGLALTGNLVAGLLVDTAHGCYQFNPEPRFWRRSRTAPADDPITFSPVLFAGEAGVSNLIAATDDFQAAIMQVRKDSRSRARDRVVLARAADWKVRWFDPIDDRLIYSIGLSSKHLYIAYTGYGANLARTSEIHRYELSMFDVLGTAD